LPQHNWISYSVDANPQVALRYQPGIFPISFLPSVRQTVLRHNIRLKSILSKFHFIE
jgi:hypothetical protein